MTRRILLLLLVPHGAAAAQDTPGKATYERWCAGCHGDAGAGDGEAASYMLPRPRDFTKGVYQVRTTASGSLPTDADLRRVIDEGMPGTAMPGWRTRLSERERNDLVSYLKSFSRFFQTDTPELLELGRAPGGGADAIAEGRQVYETLECFKCHGQAGRGDGTSAPTLTDDDGHPIRAADLTKARNFNGGAAVEQIYARLRTGLDGTPMPSFSDAVTSSVITDEQLWRVAQYVRSLSPQRQPAVREVIRAHLVPQLPASPDDTAWAGAEAYFVPLVGQIIVAPRSFAPTVDAVWVRAMHDGERLAIRIAWHDPSRSPDPVWQEWLDRVAASVHRDDTTGVVQGPDRLILQFPVSASPDAEPPFFLGGSSRRPVHVWRWESEPDRVQEGSGAGLGQFTPGPASQTTHASRFDNGEWQVQITRALTPVDTAAAPVFTPGGLVPLAFVAADGSSGENEVQGSVSAWYAVYLDIPTPGRVFVQPLVAAVFTAGLGLFVILRAQRRERGAPDSHAEAS